MANLHLVTGYGGFDHVTAADDGSMNAAIFGGGQYVLDRGNRFAVSVVTSNLVRVLDGDILMQGRHVRLNEGFYVDLTIENGTQGMNRNDLIICRYTKNTSSGIEECNLVVIKGTASSGTASDPEYTEGDVLADNAIQNDFPLYRIPLYGLTVGEPEPLFEIAEIFSDRIIPVSKGGTGATTASGARSALGITPENIDAAKTSHDHALSGLSGVLPISKGGTGATTEESARGNLGAAATVTITVSVGSSWSSSSNAGYYQTCSAPGMKAEDNPIVDIILGSDIEANDLYKKAWACVDRIVTANNSVTVYANKECPEVAFSFQAKVVR